MAKLSEKKVNLGAVSINGKRSLIYLLPESGRLQRTPRGRLLPLADFLGQIPKADARRVRQALYRAGYRGLAGIPAERNGH